LCSFTPFFYWKCQEMPKVKKKDLIPAICVNCVHKMSCRVFIYHVFSSNDSVSGASFHNRSYWDSNALLWTGRSFAHFFVSHVNNGQLINHYLFEKWYSNAVATKQPKSDPTSQKSALHNSWTKEEIVRKRKGCVTYIIMFQVLLSNYCVSIPFLKLMMVNISCFLRLEKVTTMHWRNLTRWPWFWIPENTRVFEPIDAVSTD
jgi:hypothetical protein